MSHRVLRKPLLAIGLFVLSFTYGQTDKDVKPTKWFTSLDVGAQMSGIKSEDFVWSNYSPVYRLSIGREISPNFSVQVGYQGRYFRLIRDDLRYNYDYVFIEGMLNISNLFFGKEKFEKYDLYFHLGLGYFYNDFYDRADVYWNLGLANMFKIFNSFKLKFDMSAIVGWDIYQGDSDILPNITLGVIYDF